MKEALEKLIVKLTEERTEHKKISYSESSQRTVAYHEGASLGITLSINLIKELLAHES